jgi:RimJ/RimL family protein N-acetyltransferase
LGAPPAETNAAHWRAHWANPAREDYAIEDQAGLHRGNCGLCNIDRRRRKAEIWAYIGDGRGSGLGMAAVERLLRRGFEELGLNRIYLRVLTDNPEAERFWRRFGFQPEGRWREDTLLDGKFVDSLWFSLLAREYQECQTRGAR